MAIEHFQNLVIGSGVAGKLLAWMLAKQGQKTVVVERSTPRVAVPRNVVDFHEMPWRQRSQRRRTTSPFPAGIYPKSLSTQAVETALGKRSGRRHGISVWASSKSSDGNRLKIRIKQK